MEPANLERFFAAYPEGTLISIVRDPRAWYVVRIELRARALRETSRSRSSCGGCRSSAALEARERYGERVLVLTYERLLEQPEATMAWIAERIGITMSPQLARPTFNGRPIRPTRAYPVERYGILPERASANRDSLEPERSSGSASWQATCTSARRRSRRSSGPGRC